MKKTLFKSSFLCFALGSLCFWGSAAATSASNAFDAGMYNTAEVTNARVFHLDAKGGDDANDGLSEAAAWKTFKNLKNLKLDPGDQILFKKGETFRGVLEISGQGTEELPIIVGSYGDGDAKPIITAPEGSKYALRVFNSDYLTVQNLEVVNHGRQELPGRTGVMVECRDYGVSRGIRLNDLFVRDVNGTIIKKQGGGSGILLSNTNSKGGKISTFDGLTIEYCHIKNCYRNAMIWDGCWDRTNWYANKNVLVRYNLIEEVPGDGIVPIGCDGAIIEYNVMRNGTERFDPKSRTEAAAGIWPWSCDNTIIRFNEASGHKAPWDGQGFDADYNCTNTVIEYNYSHDNWGGMVLVCAAGDEKQYDYCWGNENPIVRYNISIGDGNRPHPARGKMFSPSIHIGGPVDGLHLYRNIIHNKVKAAADIDRSMLVSDDWVGCANNTTIKENIFYAPEKSDFNFTNSKNNHIEGNYYLGTYKNLPAQSGGLPIAPKYEEFVKNSGNDGLMQLMDSVTIAGGVKCVFVNKEKIESFFNKVVPDPEFSAYVEPYFWAKGAVGALPNAETDELLSKKSVAEAESYLTSVADKIVKFDDTQYYRLRNYVRDLDQGNGKRQGNTGYMGNNSHVDWTKEVAAVSCHGSSMADASVIWAFEKVGDTNTYKIKNMNSGMYLASTDARNASKYLKFTSEAQAGIYSFEALNNVLAQYHVNCNSGNKSRNQLHASGAGVMNYNTGANDASSWYLVPATELEVAMSKFDNSRYASLYLPFDVNCDDESLTFYGVKAVDDAKEEAIAVKMEGLVAGQGAILNGSQDKYTLNINGKVSAPAFENLLGGTNMTKVMNDGRVYYILGQKAQSGIGLYKSSGSEMEMNKAFLALPEGTSLQSLRLNFDAVTGIESIVSPAVKGNNVYYDLSGRRVLNPSNGIYIQNGKKNYVR